MTNIDTSAAALDRLRERLTWHAGWNRDLGRPCSADCLNEARQMIEALAAEREEAIDQRNAADFVLALAIEQSTRHSVERDAVRAQAERWDTEAAASKGTIARLKAERDAAVAALALYRAENGCTRGQRTTQWCGEASKLRRAWLRVIQTENSCPPSGGGCLAKRCGCVAEMEMLIEEAAHD